MDGNTVVAVLAGVTSLVGAAGGLYALLSKSRRDDFEKAFEAVRRQLSECRGREARQQARMDRLGARLMWVTNAAERAFTWIEHVQPALDKASIPHPRFVRPEPPPGLTDPLADTDETPALEPARDPDGDADRDP